MLWRKPDNMRYVDLCIFIDAHAPEMINKQRNKELEDTIYNYIWLLVKALAIKKRMFESFSDYDGYAMYSAKRLFFALRKSYENEGKIIKGRTIKPIKSILNYTKALMYPMKLEYLAEQYKLNSSIQNANQQLNEFSYKCKLSNEVWESQGGKEEFYLDVYELFKSFNRQLTSVLEKAPFSNDSIEYKKIKISILLNCLNNLKNKKGFSATPITTIVWKLPKSMSEYVNFFIKKLGAQLKLEIVDSYRASQVDEKVLDFMLSNQDGEFNDHEDGRY